MDCFIVIEHLLIRAEQEKTSTLHRTYLYKQFRSRLFSKYMFRFWDKKCQSCSLSCQGCVDARVCIHVFILCDGCYDIIFRIFCLHHYISLSFWLMTLQVDLLSSHNLLHSNRSLTCVLFFYKIHLWFNPVNRKRKALR